MCNLGEGIEERGFDRALEKVILNMYKEGCDLKFIANMTEKTPSEVQEIINKTLAPLC